MGHIKNIYISYLPNDQILSSFRRGIVNSHELWREELNDEYYAIVEKKEDFERKYFRLSEAFIKDFFNEMEYDISLLNRHKEYEELFGIYFYHYIYDEFWEFINGLDDKEFFISLLYIDNIGSSDKSIDGLKKIIHREIIRNRIQIPEILKSVFIAMSFDSDMKDAREKIIEVVRAQGYKPMIIDDKEHNQLIVPQILEEIGNAEFVIADITQHRNGVYYEAGFAQGMGKEVIFTCKDSDFEAAHFDVKQINTIIWKNVFELENRLEKRIEAMMTSTIEEQHVPF
ncbi:hypothetical protein CW357_00795 [Rummeliibacillus sp. TYF005]|uniref:hypothetical protein n=1 Tax=Rummeliibacillus sp. TYF005 TaxID=2058214 RepID=UPI000F539F72|nr:hypothetical protein [Rummeliibacillus sp. TYF005]RPJ97240.1 hypothetical protein CW357_00795 [Rummeliibacillus sp. TYF005]